MHAESKRIWYYLIILFAIGWGIMMEIFQFLMHLGRAFEYNDMIGNSVGAIIGVLIYIFMVRLKRKFDRAKS